MFIGFLREQLMNADTGVSDNGASTDVGNATDLQGTPANTEVGTQQEPQPTQPAPTNEIEIDGLGKVRIDDLKEWKQGYLRQSDYTKKTTELARQRKELEKAQQVYEYLRNNPQLVQAIDEGNVDVIKNSPLAQNLSSGNSKIDELQYQLANIQLDSTISKLKSQYQDFDEVAVLTEADKMGISDLEFVYHAIQGRKVPSIKDQIKKEIEASLTAKIRQNGIDTGSIINTTDNQPQNKDFGLSQAELTIAQKMGISPQDYAKAKKL